MTSVSTDFQSLLAISKPVAFIEACYEQLLQRPISAWDLLHHLKLLKSGMPKEGLLYCICKSEEFNNRFPVPNLKQYRQLYLRYKLAEKLCPHILKSNIQSAISTVYTNLSLESSDLYTPDVEYSALSLSRIDQLRTVVTDCIDSSPYIIAGHFGKELAPFHNDSIQLSLPAFSVDTCPAKNNYLISDPRIIFQLLTGKRLLEFAHKVKKHLILTIPSVPLAPNSITAIWDENWTAIETSLFGPYTRWFYGDNHQAALKIYNNSDCYRKVRIKAHLLSLEENAELLFKHGTDYRRYTFSQPEVLLEEELYLKPFYNEFPFIYVGNGVIPSSLKAMLLRFAISGFTIEDVQNTAVYSKELLYSINADRYGTGYYPWLLSDTYIRSKLHKNGFFEVEGIFIPHSYSSVPLDISRYYYFNDSVNHKGFYIFNHGDTNITSHEGGVILYIARRSGQLSKTEFAYNTPYTE